MSEIQPNPTPTPTIKPVVIDLSDSEIAAMKEILRSNRYTDWRKEAVQKKLGGRCCVCGGLASQIASYDCSGATRIERYCNSCVEKQFSRSSKGEKL